MKVSKIIKIFVACLIVVQLFFTATAYSVSEISTHFHIFVPPNNENRGRYVMLVVTALQDGTIVDIIDDDSDDDSDDTYLNLALQRGQSYILYLKDGAVNDDAGGKWDGDLFNITANHPVMALQATKADYQHDWVPGDNKTMRSRNFILYVPPFELSAADLNVFAYEDSTYIIINDISVTSRVDGGKTTVDFDNSTLLLERFLNAGEDLIARNNQGIDVLKAGHTYSISATKLVTVQFGALNADVVRDGGGFVPASNGLALGDLFYFYVPGEIDKKEIRLTASDDNTIINLYGWDNEWVFIAQWQLAQYQHGDWVSSTEPYHLFKAEVENQKKIYIFESNWLETSTEPGTADIMTFVASETGTVAGKKFICYMAPPGDESNVSGVGSYFSHLFIYGHTPNTLVQIIDLDSLGQQINESFTLGDQKVYDFRLSRSQYRRIYNGDGNPQSGPERPYLMVLSDQYIAVMHTDWNDNWLAYAASELAPLPILSYTVDADSVNSEARVTFHANIGNPDDAPLNDCHATITLPKGVEYLSSHTDLPDTAAVQFDPVTGQTTLNWQGFQLKTSARITLTIDCKIEEVGLGTPTSFGRIFSSQLVAGGSFNADYLESQANAVVYVVSNARPAPPFSLKAQAGDAMVYVSWEKSSSVNAAGYQLYRSAYDSSNFIQITTNPIPDTTYEDSGVANGVTYFYYVRAVDGAARVSERSNIDHATPARGQLELPVPLLLSAEPDPATQSIRLTWTLELPGNAVGFYLYRKTENEQTFVMIRRFTLADTFFSDVTAGMDTLYTYSITSFDVDNNESRYSNSLSVKISSINYDDVVVFPYPNPYKPGLDEALHFRFFVTENSTVEIRLYDVAGDFIDRIEAVGAANRWVEISWDISNIASDVYIYVFESMGQTSGIKKRKIGKIAIIK